MALLAATHVLAEAPLTPALKCQDDLWIDWEAPGKAWASKDHCSHAHGFCRGGARETAASGEFRSMRHRGNSRGARCLGPDKKQRVVVTGGLELSRSQAMFFRNRMVFQ